MNSLNEIFANAGNAKAILLLASFLGGVVASISPCSLAMLPIVIGYIGGYANQPLSKTVVQLFSFIFGTAGISYNRCINYGKISAQRPYVFEDITNVVDCNNYGELVTL